MDGTHKYSKNKVLVNKEILGLIEEFVSIQPENDEDEYRGSTKVLYNLVMTEFIEFLKSKEEGSK
jgi:hypothetical protein